MIGETVVVELKGEAVEDAMGDLVYGPPTLETVDDVLVQPGASSDKLEGNRPDGAIVSYTLHFPKTWNKDVRGLRINVRGKWHEVVGDPTWYTPENTPTRWNYPVEVKRCDG